MTRAIGTYGYTEEEETGRKWDMASRALDRAEAREREAQRQTDEFDHEMTPLSEILARMN
jgi:hypothetical protein